ncbi:hypothetical protein [Enterocloster lavalensis]|uniref:hypothetical protein n=1 Tax=Enterocloster lavalensis TaxID=460384 RepID=UPI0023F2F094|nr:hypothetical protein [Enterocloster lavalensis]
MFDPHSNAVYFARYNAMCMRYALLTDQALIDRWKYHQLRSRRREDGDWIAFSVCEDLLRQRGNPYLDNHYPKD